MPKTTSYANLLLGVHRGVALAWPATVYAALMTCTNGPRSALNGATLAVNNTICLIPTGQTYMRLYKCTAISTGILAGSQGALYPGAANEVIVDGGATLTEQTSVLQAMTGASMAIAAEPTVGTNAYARIVLTSNTTNWVAAASGSIANAGTAWTWPQATPAGWTAGLQAAWGVALLDQAAAGGGNVWEWEGMQNSIQIPALATPSIAAGSYTVTES